MEMMTLVEIRTIKKSHEWYGMLDELLFLSKNLYNATLYQVRQHYFRTEGFLNYNNEAIKKQSIYQGKRVKRGLFCTSKGILLNADVNGALNILKKHCQKVAWDSTLVLDYVEACSEPVVSTIKR